MKSNQVAAYTKFRHHSAWPYTLLMLTPMIMGALIKYAHVSFFLAPFASLLIWTPSLVMDGLRRWRAVAREKQSLQAKFDAEDTALFGANPNSP